MYVHCTIIQHFLQILCLTNSVQIFRDWFCQRNNCRGNSKLNSGVPGQILFLITSVGKKDIFRTLALMRWSVIFSSTSPPTTTSRRRGECAGYCGKNAPSNLYMKYANIKWHHSFTAQTSKVAKILSNSQTYICGWIRLLKLSCFKLDIVFMTCMRCCPKYWDIFETFPWDHFIIVLLSPENRVTLIHRLYFSNVFN